MYITEEFIETVCDKIENFKVLRGRKPQYLVLGTLTFKEICGGHYRIIHGDEKIIRTLMDLRVVQCYGLTNYIGVS